MFSSNSPAVESANRLESRESHALKPYLNLTRAGLKAFFRDRQGVFWSFFFPVFFVVLFGTIFSRSDNGPEITFDVGLVLQDRSPEVAWVPQVFDQIKVLKMHQGTLEEEKSALLEGK